MPTLSVTFLALRANLTSAWWLYFTSCHYSAFLAEINKVWHFFRGRWQATLLARTQCQSLRPFLFLFFFLQESPLGLALTIIFSLVYWIGPKHRRALIEYLFHFVLHGYVPLFNFIRPLANHKEWLNWPALPCVGDDLEVARMFWWLEGEVDGSFLLLSMDESEGLVHAAFRWTMCGEFIPFRRLALFNWCIPDRLNQLFLLHNYFFWVVVLSTAVCARIIFTLVCIQLLDLHEGQARQHAGVLYAGGSVFARFWINLHLQR